jgi:hypothetical protein
MINMSVGKHYTVDLFRVEEKLAVAYEVLLVASLEETAIQ